MSIRLKRTAQIATLLACCAILLASLFLFVTSWLDTTLHTSTWDARAAYKTLGTNAFPEFIEVLQAKDRFSDKQQIIELLPSLRCEATPLIRHLFPYIFVRRWDKNELVLWSQARQFFFENDCPGLLDEVIHQLTYGNTPELKGFAASLLPRFGPAARKAIPALTPLLNEGNSKAALAITAIQPDFPDLPERLVHLAASTNLPSYERRRFLTALQSLGPRATHVADDTSKLLHHPAQRESDRSLAFDWESDVLSTLGSMGPAASNTLPAIRPYLTKLPRERCLFAARAYIQIQPDAALLVPVLTNFFQIQPFPSFFNFAFDLTFDDPVVHHPLYWNRHPFTTNSITTAAYLLGKLGPEANSALPALESLTGLHGTTEHLFVSWAIAKIKKQEKNFASDLLRELDAPKDVRNTISEVHAVHLLAELGSHAEMALPKLQLLAAHKDPSLRATATNAIARIQAAIHKRDRALTIRREHLPN